MKGGKDNHSVDKIAVSVVYHSSIYDMRLRSTFKLMDKYKEIVCQVVSTLESELGIILTKEPVYKTILNRVKKVLLSHRAFRNKEKKSLEVAKVFPAAHSLSVYDMHDMFHINVCMCVCAMQMMVKT